MACQQHLSTLQDNNKFHEYQKVHFYQKVSGQDVLFPWFLSLFNFHGVTVTSSQFADWFPKSVKACSK